MSAVVCLSLHWVPAPLAYPVGGGSVASGVFCSISRRCRCCAVCVCSRSRGHSWRAIGVSRCIFATVNTVSRFCVPRTAGHGPRRGGSLPAVRIMRVLMCGAGVVFAVVLVPVLAVRPLLLLLPCAPWGVRPRCTHLHCSLCGPFHYCLRCVAVFPGIAFPGRMHTISICQRARGFAKFSRYGSAAICICYVVPCQL